MKFFLYFFIFLFASNAHAEDALWDLDTVVNQVQNYPAINLNTNSGIQQTLSKTYVYKLDEIRKKISQQSGVYPKFIISSSQEINAGATWQNGQPITIFNLGLLKKVGEDYDAIAAVVSHEFSHLSLKHQQSQQTTNAVVDILAGLALIAIDSKYGGQNRNPYHGLYQTGLDLTASLAKNSYSRSEELEADAQGVKYMIASGYSPEGAIRLQENIIPSNSSFFSTHPSSGDRIQNIKIAMNSLPSYKNRIEENRTAIALNNTGMSQATKALLDKRDLDFYLKTCEDIGFKEHTSHLNNCIFKLSGNKIQLADLEKQLPNSVNNTIKSNIYIDTCNEIGFKLNTKSIDDCVTKLKGDSKVNKSFMVNENILSSNLPSKGQIGSVISIKQNDNYVIFASSIQATIPSGTNIKISSGSEFVNGTISKYYDGYYSAIVEKTNSIKQGSKVIFSD